MYDSTFSSWNVSLYLVDTKFHGIQNDIRRSGSLISFNRKAILSKVTCCASSRVMVMSILKPEQRQVTLVPFISGAAIINIFIAIEKETQKQKGANTKPKEERQQITLNIINEEEAIKSTISIHFFPVLFF